MLTQLIALYAALHGGDKAAPLAASPMVAPAAITAPAVAVAKPVVPIAPAVTSDQPAPVAEPALVGPTPVFLQTLPAAQAGSAAAVVDAVQAFYKNTPQLVAKFRQTTLNATFGIPKANDGRVYLKKPGKMRWDYFSKREKNKVVKTQLSDGKTAWNVDYTGKWYWREDLNTSALPVAVTFLTGKGDLHKEFNAKIDSKSKYGSKDDVVLALTPKKPSAQFKTLYLVVDAASHRVKQSVVVNAAGDTNIFRFYEPDTKKSVQDTWFVFNPKASAAKGFREIQAGQNQPTP